MDNLKGRQYLNPFEGFRFRDLRQIIFDELQIVLGASSPPLTPTTAEIVPPVMLWSQPVLAQTA